jgi:hypothetical protein
MEIGASIFFIDYSMAPTELAVALEARGFDSLDKVDPAGQGLTRYLVVMAI